MQTRPIAVTAAALGLTVLFGSPAAAQWYVAGSLGANHSQASTVTVDVPASGTRLTFANVPWTSESFRSPQYYGYRIGRLFGSARRWGLELEFIHPKMFGTTSTPIRIQGVNGGQTIDVTAPMDTFVTRYAMSHGMNFALANLVRRVPVAGRTGALALTLRGGIGVAIPHTEMTIGGAAVDQYEIGGPAVGGAAGLDVRLFGRVSATGEYKLGYARPEITAPGGGTGRTTALVHQWAAGLAIGFAPR